MVSKINFVIFWFGLVAALVWLASFKGSSLEPYAFVWLLFTAYANFSKNRTRGWSVYDIVLSVTGSLSLIVGGFVASLYEQANLGFLFFFLFWLLLAVSRKIKGSEK